MSKKNLNPETVSLIGENNTTLSITNTGLSNEIKVSTSPSNSMVTFTEKISKNVYKTIIELGYLICEDTKNFDNHYQDDLGFQYKNSFDDSKIRGIWLEELHVSFGDGKANITTVVPEGSEQSITFQIHNAEKLFKKNTVEGLLTLFKVIKNENRIAKKAAKEKITP